MKNKILIIVITVLSLEINAQQDWPYNGDYIFFGSNLLDQSLSVNYSLLQHKANGTTFLNSPESVHLRIDNGDKLVIANNGNIGIGTTSPNDKLEIRDGKIRISNGTDRMYIDVDNANGKSIIAFGDDLNDRLDFYFDYWDGTSVDKEVMSILANGTVGIGTTTPDSKLTVKGNIHAEEVKVDLSVPGPDYVFKEGYNLKSLEEVQSYIQEHGHLPNMPSAKEMEENGIQLGDMNMKLLEKIEELTLYILEQEEKMAGQEKRLREIEKLLDQTQ